MYCLCYHYTCLIVENSINILLAIVTTSKHLSKNAIIASNLILVLIFLVCGSPNSSFASSMFSDYIEIPSREKQDTLCTIEALAARLKAGRFSGQRIVMCYRAAMHMDVNYLDILRENDVLNLLKQAINGNCLNKLVVISDIIGASGFTSLQV